MFDEIAGIKDALGLATRIVKFAEKAYSDSGLRQKFEDTGKVAVGLDVENYRIVFQIEDTKKASIPAEIMEAEE